MRQKKKEAKEAFREAQSRWMLNEFEDRVYQINAQDQLQSMQQQELAMAERETIKSKIASFFKNVGSTLLNWVQKLDQDQNQENPVENRNEIVGADSGIPVEQNYPQIKAFDQ